MRIGLVISAVVAFAMSTAPIHAQCGTGSGVLDMPDTIPLGGTVTIKMDAPPPADMILLMFSLGEGPIDFASYGTICLDMPPLLMLEFTLVNGHAEVSGSVPCDPALIGIKFFGQFLTCDPGGTRRSHGSSNQESIEIVDGICDGGLCTFTPGGWGATCSGNNAGCILDKYFPTVFPNGVSIGDPDGIDGDGEFALHFTSAAAIEAYLPAGGPSVVLTADATDPTDNPGGSLANHLLAAKLNVAFDADGALDGCKTRLDLNLGNLVFKGGVDSDLLGMSVNDLLDLADAALSGALGSGPFDLDGDTQGDVTLEDITTALTVINENFDNGTTNNGNLGSP